MSNLEKTKEVLALIVTAASAIVALSEIWTKIAPEVKKIVKPLVDDCKKIVDDNADSNNGVKVELKAIKGK